MPRVSRRSFLASTAAAGASLAAPAVVTAQKSDSRLIVGEGDHRFEVIHDWPQLPRRFSWQTTHNVAVDREGFVYVIHEGHADKPDHPAIFVFDADGKYVRSFGKQFQGGGHGLEVRNEGGQDFLYVTAYKHLKTFAKLDMAGEVVWRKMAPIESGFYAKGEDTRPQNVWGRDRFMPTNFAFLPDGSFYVADGYGAYRIHRYDMRGQWAGSFGEPGREDGQFDTPHGLWIDDRGPGDPLVVVADRANARLQWFTTEGRHVRTQGGFTLPANVDRRDEYLLVPDLVAQVCLLDGQNRIVARLGRDPEWEALVAKKEVRNHPTRWPAGKFVHPHDACFDHRGDILVAEWVSTGRVSKLRRV